MTIKSIGSSGADYSTMSLAEAGLSGFGTMTDAWTFVVFNEVINEGGGGVAWSDGYSGQSTTNNVTIRPDFAGSGATGSSSTDCSFAGNNDYSSVALQYNGTAGKGAGFTGFAFPSMKFQGWMVIKDLQFLVSTNGTLHFNSSHEVVFARNLCKNRQPYDGSGLRVDGATVVANCLHYSTNSPQGSNATLCFLNVSNYFISNTFCVSRHSGSSGTTSESVTQTHNATPVFRDCAVYSYDPTNSHTNRLNYGATRDSDYNVGNCANGQWAGTNDSNSGNIANDFETADVSGGTESSNVDFRPKAGGLLLAFTPSASRYTSLPSWATGYNDTDIRGQTRVGVDNDAGCFQKTAAGGGGTTFKWWKNPRFTGGFQEMTGGFDALPAGGA